MFVQEKLEALVKASQAFQDQPAEMEALWSSCSCLLYSLEDRQKQLGLGNKVGFYSMWHRVRGIFKPILIFFRVDLTDPTTL